MTTHPEMVAMSFIHEAIYDATGHYMDELCLKFDEDKPSFRWKGRTNDGELVNGNGNIAIAITMKK